ncbi:MAG: hypothetical protein ACLU9T_11125 [Blautia faecis]
MKVIVYLPSVITAASVSVLFKSLVFPVRTNHPDFEVTGAFLARTLDFMSSVAGSRGLISTNSVVDVAWQYDLASDFSVFLALTRDFRGC